MNSNLLTVQEAANLLNVSVSTFKRMCDVNDIPVSRTPGGHRRIDRSALDKVIIESIRPQISTEFTSIPSNHQQVVDCMMMHLIHDRVDDAMDLLRNLALQYNALSGIPCIRLIEDTVVAALWKIGNFWSDAKIPIYRERIASDAAMQLLDRINSKHSGFLGASRSSISTSNVIAVGGTFEGSSDTIGSKLIECCLRLIGVSALDLGSNLSAKIISDATHDLNANLVWINHTHVASPEQILEQHLELRALLPQDTQVVIGGGGISPAIRRSLPNCHYFESAHQLAQYLITPTKTPAPISPTSSIPQPHFIQRS